MTNNKDDAEVVPVCDYNDDGKGGGSIKIIIIKIIIIIIIEIIIIIIEIIIIIIIEIIVSVMINANPATPLSPECNAVKCQEGTLGGIKRETE